MTTLATNMTLGLRQSVSEIDQLVQSVKQLQWEFFPYQTKVKQSDPKTMEFIRYALDATDESIRYWNQTFDINSLYKNFLNYPDNWINPKYWDAFCTVRGL